jgi:hypothetical protein
MKLALRRDLRMLRDRSGLFSPVAVTKVIAMDLAAGDAVG